jgi:hypothetical protein
VVAAVRTAEVDSVPRRLAAVGLCSLALAAAGCGTEAASSGPLADAVKRTEAANTAHLVSITRGANAGIAYVHRRAGVVDYEHAFSAITKRSTMAGESMPPSREVKLGDELYTRMAAGSWIHEHIGNGNATGGVDPTHLLGVAEGAASDAVVVGHRSLHGQSVTLYRAKVDLRAAAERELHDLGWKDGAIDQFLGDELQGTGTLEAWVDANGLIRRIVLRSSSETETLNLSDFGVHVSAHAPS